MNYKPVYRTAPATPGLLKKMHLSLIFRWELSEKLSYNFGFMLN